MSRKILDGEIAYQKMQEYLNEPLEKQRYRFFTGSVYTFVVVDKSETDTHVYYGQNEYKPMFNNGLFYKRINRNGMTYDKQAKKVKFWYGKAPLPVIVHDFEKDHRVDEWKSILHPNFESYYCVSYLNDIAKGKINSISDFAEHLTKKSLMFKGLDKYAITKVMLSPCYAALNIIASILQVAENQSDAADWIVANSENNLYYGYYNIPNLARAINTKVNFLDYDNEAERIRNEITKQDETGVGKGMNILPF